MHQRQGGALATKAAHGPGTRDQRDGSILRKGKVGTQPIAKRKAGLRAQGHEIAGRGSLTSDERGPEIVEILEMRVDIDRPDLDPLQSNLFEEVLERGRLAELEPP